VVVFELPPEQAAEDDGREDEEDAVEDERGSARD
jgi:hypothetical protein